jgi:hypothetical protein
LSIAESLAAQPTASIPQASGDWAAAKAIYRFWNNPKVGAEEILEGHQSQVRQRVAQQQVVLAIQDTTDLSFVHHPSKSEEQGFGLLSGQDYLLGLKVHSTLAVSGQGVPLGILDQQVWARSSKDKGKAKQRRRRSLKQKESLRWLRAQVASELQIPEGVTLVTVADAEADIYQLMALERSEAAHLLLRVHHNRRVEHPSRYLKAAMAEAPVAGTTTVEVSAKAGCAPRRATLSVRFKQVLILPPHNCPARTRLSPLTLNVIWAQEEHPPEGAEPIDWMLITTLNVSSFEQACQCLRWYALRWLIERFHYVLKSGCCIEQLQLQNAERIQRALATYDIVAWRLLWLTYEARLNSEQSCEVALEPFEWQALYCYIHQAPFPPPQPPSLQQAVLWIARLGGFLARHGDGPPGVKTLWRGLRRLHDIAATWRLLHSIPLTTSVSGDMGKA